MNTKKMQFSTIQKNVPPSEPDSAGIVDKNVIRNIEIETGSKQKHDQQKNG